MLGLSKTICMTVIMKSLNIISHTQHTATKKELITHVLELKIRIGIYMYYGVLFEKLMIPI